MNEILPRFRGLVSNATRTGDATDGQLKEIHFLEKPLPLFLIKFITPQIYFIEQSLPAFPDVCGICKP